MKSGWLYEIMVRVVPFTLAWVLRCWFMTCRVTVHGEGNRERVLEMQKGAIAIFWHYSLVYVFYQLRADSAAVVVSGSEDGEYIARLAHHLNFETIRGSRNRGGMRALKEMLAFLRKGDNLGVVADGSQGPPLVVQGGAIMVASKTGSPILPMVWSASSYFTFGSWDRTAIPKPFSHIHYHYGEPMLVPAGLDSDGIENCRRDLEDQMNEMYRTAWSQFNRQEH